MNGHFLTRTHLALFALLILPWLFLFFLRSVLSPSLTCALGAVAIICTFTSLAFLLTSLTQARPVIASSTLVAPSPEASFHKQLSIPTTVAEMLRQMNFRDFELFSGAVIVGLGEGHRFRSHSGRRGDRGVDIKLRNRYDQLVLVQAKFYTPPNRVGASQVRDLGGAISTHDAVYGYFVTTSTFTSGALDEKESHGRIRTIDGPELERLLQTRSHEIAQAYESILQQIQNEA